MACGFAVATPNRLTAVSKREWRSDVQTKRVFFVSCSSVLSMSSGSLSGWAAAASSPLSSCAAAAARAAARRWLRGRAGGGDWSFGASPTRRERALSGDTTGTGLRFIASGKGGLIPRFFAELPVLRCSTESPEMQKSPKCPQDLPKMSVAGYRQLGVSVARKRATHASRANAQRKSISVDACSRHAQLVGVSEMVCVALFTLRIGASSKSRPRSAGQASASEQRAAGQLQAH